MNRKQRRQRAKLSEVCIFCELADGSMGVDDFERYCREVALEYGPQLLDEIAIEIREDKNIPPVIAGQAQVVLAYFSRALTRSEVWSTRRVAAPLRVKKTA
jgi:hypothetical protein